jgi:hypothetical protein
MSYIGYIGYMGYIGYIGYIGYMSKVLVDLAGLDWTWVEFAGQEFQ